MTVALSLPFIDDTIMNLHIGDAVAISGVLVTARDAAHQWLYDRFIVKTVQPSPSDTIIYNELKKLLDNNLIYHCGPIVHALQGGAYQFISAGPTTSMREEIYQADIIKHFNLKGVIGKGGMGMKTLRACQQAPAAYFHAVGGAGALIAGCVDKVLGVYKMDLGMPEAMWVIHVKDFPAVVTMDAHGSSLHHEMQERSHIRLNRLTN